MFRRCISLVLYLTIPFLVLSGCAQTERKPVPENQGNNNQVTYSTLLEAAQADPYENGCVSCHKKTAEVDRSLPVYVAKIQGHPEVKEATVNACYQCHEAQKNYNLYKKFVRGTHQVHWKSSIFYQKQNATCNSCHTAESNGVSGLKEYPLAGYRTGVTAKAETKAQQAPKQKAQPKPGTTDKTPQQQDTRQQDGQQPDRDGESNETESTELPTPTP